MPDLIIIAGCNGAGKSTFSSSFLPEGLTSFDYDRLFLENYNSLSDSELREVFARNQTTKDFESSIDKALLNKADFCYETNFDSDPLHWAQKFKENGYQINLIFFCLDNQEIARHRIQFFDNILFVDNSKQNDIYTNLLQIEKGEIVLMTEKIPDYFKHRFPDIFKLIKSE